MRNIVTTLVLIIAVICVTRGQVSDSSVAFGSLSALTRIAVSPDGKRLAFEGYGPAVTSGTYSLPVSRVEPRQDHVEQPRLLAPNGHNLRWSPDSTSFLFDKPTSQPPDAHSSIWIGNVGSTRSRWVAYGRMGCWSPDGKALAFVRANRLLVVRTKNPKPRVVFDGGPRASGDLEDPVWAPDGREIVVSRADGRLWAVNPLGGTARPLTWSSSHKADLQPSFSPDGRCLAFTRGYYGQLRSVEGVPVMQSHEIVVIARRSCRVIYSGGRSDGRSDESPQWLGNNRIAFVRGTRLAFAWLRAPSKP